MTIHVRAGNTAKKSDLIDTDLLIKDYYNKSPIRGDVLTHVSFGTSGHRGCSYKASFNERHIIAITMAIIEFRKTQNINGPIFIGKRYTCAFS